MVANADLPPLVAISYRMERQLRASGQFGDDPEQIRGAYPYIDAPMLDLRILETTGRQKPGLDFHSP
jgi:hypothetical protein